MVILPSQSTHGERMTNLVAQSDRVLRALPLSSLSTATLTHDIHDSPCGPLFIILVLAAARRHLLSHYEAEDIQERAASGGSCSIGATGAVGERMQPLAGRGVDPAARTCHEKSVTNIPVFCMDMRYRPCSHVCVLACACAWTTAYGALDCTCIEV